MTGGKPVARGLPTAFWIGPQARAEVAVPPGIARVSEPSPIECLMARIAELERDNAALRAALMRCAEAASGALSR